MRRINPTFLFVALAVAAFIAAFCVLAVREQELAALEAAASDATPAPTATQEPTTEPTAASTAKPTAEPAAEPTTEPTPEPAAEPTAAPDTKAGPKLEIDPNAGARVTPTPAPREPGVAIPGWGSMTLPSGTTTAQTALRNPEENEGYYYLTFELRLPEQDAQTGEEGYEVLFTTGLVPPGQYCNQVTLTRELEPGEYTAVVHVQPYRIADMSPTNNADMETLLIVR